jgi:hypothetical protein
MNTLIRNAKLTPPARLGHAMFIQFSDELVAILDDLRGIKLRKPLYLHDNARNTVL